MEGAPRIRGCIVFWFCSSLLSSSEFAAAPFSRPSLQPPGAADPVKCTQGPSDSTLQHSLSFTQITAAAQGSTFCRSAPDRLSMLGCSPNAPGISCDALLQANTCLPSLAWKSPPLAKFTRGAPSTALSFCCELKLDSVFLISRPSAWHAAIYVC